MRATDPDQLTIFAPRLRLCGAGLVAVLPAAAGSLVGAAPIMAAEAT
jgi:hypothetical protein